MRLLNGDDQTPMFQAQLYLTVPEATKLQHALARLLENPDASIHEHVLDDDGLREISLSVLTTRKLEDLSGYTEAEIRMIQER